VTVTCLLSVGARYDIRTSEALNTGMWCTGPTLLRSYTMVRFRDITTLYQLLLL